MYYWVIVLISVLTVLAGVVPPPDHCYDFVSSAVSDPCGSVPLTMQSKITDTDGVASSPYCDLSGC